jgi:hypothetical protein
MSKQPPEAGVNKLRADETPTAQPVYIGDPADKAIIRSLARRNTIPYLFIFILLAGNLVQYLRNPEIITAIMTEDGRQVVQINNRHYGKTDLVSLAPDRPADADKIYLVRKFTDNLFGLDPTARKYQLEFAYTMLLSKFAASYFNEYKASGLLDKQRNERWQAKWEIQKIEVDRRDPYLIHVIGTQDITKYTGEKTEREVVQQSLDFKLVDDYPRSDRNLRTGFLISAFGGNAIDRKTPTDSGLTTQLPN